uniref:CNNM transmembrane domain-containing protein n=1 Tax=Parascaris univalens TaxID=6257 RepID=A0A914ZIB1_PARUN
MKQHGFFRFSSILTISCVTCNIAVTEADTTPANRRAAVVIGLRVEAPPEESSFGYDSKGVCVINPETEVKVVIYGLHLESVAALLFTTSDECANVTRTITADQFILHFEHKAIFMLSLPHLPENIAAYKICVKQRNSALNADIKPVSF